MNRMQRIENLIRRLCGIMTNEVRCYRSSDFDAIRAFIVDDNAATPRQSLEDAIESLRVEAFLKPIIRAEMIKIIHDTPPQSLSKKECGDDVVCQKFVGDIAVRNAPYAVAANG